MKKITLLLLTIFYCVVGYSQFPENFETATVPNGFPAGWLVTDNGVGTVNSWTIATNASVIINGTKSAYMNREEIGALNTSEDWLITPLAAIPANGQLRFFTKQSLAGDNGTIYQIRISSGTSQSNLAPYVVLKEWTEAQLNNVYNVAEEKVVDFPAAVNGTSIYIAFVRVYTQPTVPSGPLGGDRWSIDDVNVVQKCLAPIGLTAGTIAASSASLTWNASTASQGYDLAIIPATQTFEGAVTNSSAVNSFNATGLIENTAYKYYVRSNCGNGNYSEWVGPFNFSTLAIGTSCSDPIVIPSLPYQTVDNTGNYGNTLPGPQLSSCISGSTNYQSGNDVFYSYTATENCSVSFTLDPTQTRSSMFIYPSCAGITGACLAAVGNASANPRILNYAVTAGTTYIIVISSNNQTQTVGYNLLIQCENCTEKPTALGASNITLNSADFTWTAPAGTVLGYEVAVQPQGSSVPSGAGVDTGSATPGFTASLAPATLYQYWVRSECSDGNFSAWAGPYLFNTQLCAAADQCTYIFRMTDTANNGWNGARMQIRQNGILLETIGATYTSGAGPVDISVTVCNNVPFDIFWSIPGSQPQQCVVSIINSFGQTIDTVLGSAVSPGTSIYQGNINCTTPLCTIAPINVTVNPITTTGGTINWDAPGTENVGFDIYIVAAGSPAPTAGTTPTYSGVNGPAAPFSSVIPTAYLPDTEYDVYVRVVCSPNSPWSIAKKFKTLPTCPKPTNQTVTEITTTSAILGWTEAASATQWEVLLLPAPNAIAPAAPGATIVPAAGEIYIQNITGATTVTPTLVNATIYYYYVRSVCQPGNDASTWTGPFIFNTLTCDAADKCNYKFLLTNTTNNNWNGGRVQVRQNGIVVATLGGGGINNANGITVALCNNVPYDLFWSVAGTLPEGMGLTVIDVNNDIVYTKTPGQGTPLTVLYEDTTLGNCTPPSCPKPIDLLVNATAQNTANLSWTETGSAIQWEVYAVVEGGTPPVNGSPLNTGIAGYYIADSNANFQIAGLLSGTQYQYYVRAICSTTERSNWTLLTPKSFITRPANDDCVDAISVPVNPTQVCAQLVAGNTLGGTASVETSNCPGSENDDVWFKFVATNNIHIVNLLNVTGTTTNIRFAVYEGTDCGTLNQIFCSATNNNTAVLTNIVAGNTYKIRVYTNGTNTNQSASFDVCVSTPPSPGPNDEVINAIPVTVNVLSECAYTTPGNLIGATGSTGVSNACAGNEDDDVWFSFVAPSSTNVITLLNVEGTTTNLNHAVYSGTPTNLVQLYCGPATGLTSTNTNYVVNQTYYIRVWSNGSNSEVVTFDVCVKPVSTCGNAAPFCGGTVQQPYIFPNSSGLPSAGQVACLFTTPNPTYYTLHVGQTGPLNFTMVQNTNISPTGQLLGTNQDVDFVAWGPFTSTDSCDDIVFGPCPGGCPNNTSNPSFYPSGNIVDCSYSASYTETISIPNAQAGEYYIILLTNYNGQPGFISLVQTNFDSPSAGTTICCDVDLGPDVIACADSVTLNALAGVLDLDNVPVTFAWYFNNVLIPGEINSTIVVTQSGTYSVKGSCGVNPVEDTIVVALSPAISIVSPPPYDVCDDAPIDGFAPFDLNILTPQVLGTLDPTLYNVSYYILEADAIADAVNSINLTTPFVNTVPNNQTIYIRVESNAVGTCFAVVPVDLEVGSSGSAKFGYSATSYCKNDTVTPTPIYVGGGIAGTFTATPEGLVIDPITGDINIASSAVGAYIVTNTVADAGPCGNAVFTTPVEIKAVPVFTVSGTMEICPEGSTTITVIPTSNSFELSAVSFEWTFNGVVIAGATSSSLIIQGGSGYGSYTVTVDYGGCVSTQTFEITQSTTQWNVTLVGSANLCPTETGTLTASVTNNTNGSPVSYIFTLPDGTEVVSASNVLTINDTGVYSVVVDILGCLSTPVSFTVGESIPDWQVSFIGEPYVICTGESTTLSFTAVNFDIDNANAVYTWTTPSGATSLGKTLSANAVGTYTLSVNIFGCISTFDVVVSENTLAIDIDFTQGCDNNVYRLVAVPFNNSFDVPTSTFTWSGPSVIATDQANAIGLGLSGDYTVTVTNSQGCSATKTVSVNNISCTIQKGISPNNDGDNDSFDLSALNVKELFIFNRYGTEVYKFGAYTDQWKGQSSGGKELPDGTYFYVIKTAAGENITGWIQINR